MEELFIKRIYIEEVRNLKDFDIPMNDSQKKHLVITGKNGSGKTSLLEEIKRFILHIPNHLYQAYDSHVNFLEAKKKEIESFLKLHPNDSGSTIQVKTEIENTINWIAQFGGVKLFFNKNSVEVTKQYQEGNYIISYFEAKRNTKLKTPKGIQKIETKPTYNLNEQVGKEFIQYIVNLKADRSFAKDEDDQDAVKKIDEWFEVFESNFKKLFNIENVKLQFDRKDYNFNIIEEDKIPYNLNQLSDGYSAILNIVTELIMRMEDHKGKNYDVQGIALIDEIETHLHIELQKKILPFLTTFFPKMQFIVSTHSPFVISSIKDAVICDLEKKIVVTDLSGYSYDTLIESYFDSDKYSKFIKDELAEYEALLNQEYKTLKEQQKERLFELKQYFNEIPKFMADELAVKIQQLRLKEIKKKD